MHRIPEPELMDDAAQARAYAEADFSEPHNHFVQLFREAFPGVALTGTVLDLGCGPADVTIRLALDHPACRIDGVDAARAMLDLGREAVQRAGIETRIRLIQGYLPGAELPEPSYTAVVSNSLLHHLADPAVLWAAVRQWGQPGAPVWIMDLRRPDTPEQVAALVQTHAADAPEVLRRDFEYSLRAAYRPEEVRTQLQAAGLENFTVSPIGNRHLVVAGRLPL